MTPDEEAFVKELARRAKVQDQSPRSSTLEHVIPTTAGKVTVSPQEKNSLDAVCAREGKTETELIDQYLK
jgi:hypothetical protein